MTFSAAVCVTMRIEKAVVEQVEAMPRGNYYTRRQVFWQGLWRWPLFVVPREPWYNPRLAL